MAFMRLQVTPKGALYLADCDSCGHTLATHEWADCDHNDRRDAMQAGTLRCDECFRGKAAPDSFNRPKGLWYAARYSAPGYLDATRWSYDTNRRRLEREVRDLYGDVT
jgi:hypothetical protein